jgi:RNA polymerase sigma-70 factor (ECF subfamily)
VTEADWEEQIKALLGVGDLQGAATRTIEHYGPELLGFLVTLLRSEQDASEVFSQSCEDLWRGLQHFEGRSAVRTWFYKLGRHAAARFRRSPYHRGPRHAGLSEAQELAERVRTQTLSYLRTTAKDGITAIRDSLEEQDQALLVLRVDRDMSWNDIARVLELDGESDEGLARAAAKLRKRFQVLKDEIRQRARAAGLLPKPES